MYVWEKFCHKIVFQIKSKIPGISEYKFYQPKEYKDQKTTIENIEYKLHLNSTP
jgi:hypothetical protein